MQKEAREAKARLGRAGGTHQSAVERLAVVQVAHGSPHQWTHGTEEQAVAAARGRWMQPTTHKSLPA